MTYILANYALPDYYNIFTVIDLAIGTCMNQDPPELADFNSQVEDLITQYGAAAFCTSSGQSPTYVLFVEEDKVIAEPRNAPPLSLRVLLPGQRRSI
jgi:hypothetical protein